MEINNFTDTVIRLGEWPFGVDVQNIPLDHSDDGICCQFFLNKSLSGDGKPRIVIVKPLSMERIIVFVMRHERQAIYIPEGEIIYDSAEVK